MLMSRPLIHSLAAQSLLMAGQRLICCPEPQIAFAFQPSSTFLGFLRALKWQAVKKHIVSHFREAIGLDSGPTSGS